MSSSDRLPYLLAILASFLHFFTFPASLSAASVYKCKGPDGSTVFSDVPCRADAKPVATFRSANQAPPPDPIWCRGETASEALVSTCLDAWRPSFRDPRSAYAEGGVIVRNKGTKAPAVFVSGYAMNGFGGMNALVLECGIRETGSIDPAATATWIKLYRAFQTLKVERTPHDVQDCGD